MVRSAPPSWVTFLRFSKKYNLGIDIYTCVFLSNYYQLLLVYYPFDSIALVINNLIKASGHFSAKSLIDTLLLDSLFFSNATLNPKIVLNYARIWKESVTTPKFMDSFKRSSISEIRYRTSSAVTAISTSRSLPKPEQNRFVYFLEHYFTIRQLFDDLCDYDSDIKNGIYSYAVRFGKKKTKAILESNLNQVKALQIPLFYKNITELYSKYFLH